MENEELSTQVRKLAALAYTPEEVGRALGYSPDEVSAELEKHTGEFYRQYWGGWYEADAALRQSIFSLAAAGSGPAQTLAHSIIQKAEAKRGYE